MWARIVVLEGRVDYEALSTGDVVILAPEISVVVEPEVAHKVTPSADARFYVEFLRRDLPIR